MKKIIIITIAFILCLQSVCCAADFSRHLMGSAVNVVESKDSIDIYARVSFVGDVKDSYVPNMPVTYSEAFIIGVQYVWSGVYNGKPVYVHIEEVEDTEKTRRVRVMFDVVKNKLSFAHAQKHPPTVWMYTGDGRMGGYIYDYSALLYVCGHEFGHAALGLADAYSDPHYPVSEYLNSPMNGWDSRHATDADYYILLKHRTWLNDGLFTYSNDREFLKQYLSQ